MCGCVGGVCGVALLLARVLVPTMCHGAMCHGAMCHGAMCHAAVCLALAVIGQNGLCDQVSKQIKTNQHPTTIHNSNC